FEQPEERAGQRVCVPWRREEALLVVAQDLWDPAYVGGRDRQPHRHPLKGHQRRGVAPRRDRQATEIGQLRPDIVGGSGGEGGAGGTELGGERRELLAEGELLGAEVLSADPRAYQGDPGLGVGLAGDRRRAEEDIEALLCARPADNPDQRDLGP